MDSDNLASLVVFISPLFLTSLLLSLCYEKKKKLPSSPREHLPITTSITSLILPPELIEQLRLLTQTPEEMSEESVFSDKKSPVIVMPPNRSPSQDTECDMVKLAEEDEKLKTVEAELKPKVQENAETLPEGKRCLKSRSK